MFKKGQITIFSIIGILLLLIIGVIIYFVQIREVTSLSRKVAELAVVPSEFEPVRAFISSCLEQVSKQGVKILGMQGGFIASSKFSFDPFEPTEGEAVQLSPNSKLIIPYWFYLKNKNNCEGKCDFAGNFPFLHRSQGAPSIESQIDSYVDKNIQNCFSNFTFLKEKGFVIEEKGKFNSKSTVADTSVFVEADYPLVIKLANSSYAFKEHIVELDLNLKEIYNLALNITNLQKEHRYLERATKQLLSAFSHTNPRALPPFSDLDIDFSGGVYWSLFDIENRLKQLLSTYIRFLQVFYTKNYEYIRSPAGFPGIVDEDLFENLYNRHFLIFLNESHPDLSVNFNYLDWLNPYVNLNCRGQLCGPESFSFVSLFIFGIQQYSFAYDVSFPVLVDIANSDALKGEGFSFKFFLESNLRNNDPMPAVFKSQKRLGFETGSLLTNLEQFTSSNVSFEVCDGKTRRPIDYVHVAFTCGTESVALGELLNGKITTKLPRCLNGYVSFVKDNYFSTHVQIDTFLEEDQTISTCIYPYHHVNFSIKKYLVKKSPGGWYLDTENPVLHERNESSFIILARNGTEYEESFTSFAEIYGDKLFAIDAELGRNIRLIPGTYDVKVQTFLYADPPLIIPPEVRCKKFFKGYEYDCECFLIPDNPVLFNYTNPLPAGRISYNWMISPEELYGAKEIEFPQVYFDLYHTQPDCSSDACLTSLESTYGDAFLYGGTIGLLLYAPIAAALPEESLSSGQKELLRKENIDYQKPFELAKAIKKVAERAKDKKVKVDCGREIEDLNQLGKLEKYVAEYPDLFKPVIKR